MTISKRRIFALTAVLMPLSLAVLAAEDAPVMLTRTYKADAKAVFETRIEAKINGTEIESVENTHQVVKEIKKNGDVVVETTMDGGKVTFSGTTQDTPAGPPRLTTFDKTGKIADYKTDESGLTVFPAPVSKLLAIASAVLLPSKAVKPKDTWTTELDNPAAKNKKLTITDTYLGTEEIGKLKIVKIQQVVKADVDGEDAPMSQDMTAWISPEDGLPFKVESKAKNVPSSFGTMSWASTTERVKANKLEKGKEEGK